MSVSIAPSLASAFKVPNAVVSPGNPPTVRQVVDAHGRFVWRTIRHMGIPESDVPDVRQNVFLTVHRKLADFEGRGSVRTWLYGICMRVCSEHRRRAHRKRERLSSDTHFDEHRDDEPTPDIAAQQRNMLMMLLDLLDDEKRAVVVLYEIEGFTLKEAAKILGCPISTLHSRLRAAHEIMELAVGNERSE